MELLMEKKQSAGDEMNTKTESRIAILAALFVLLSALWDARISAAVAILALAGLGAYKLLRKN